VAADSGDVIVVQHEFQLALELTNSFEVQAASILHRKNPLNEFDSLRLFSLFDLTEAGYVTIAEIQRVCRKEASLEAHDIIQKYRDTPLAHLRDRFALKMVFGKIDTNKNGGISINEWKTFLAELMRHDVDYLRRKGLAEYRAFFGKKAIEFRPRQPDCETAEGDQKTYSPLETWIYRFVDAGWLADFWYYQKNHHPLLALFLADPDNPLSRLDRVKIELAVNGYNLFASTIAVVQSDSFVNRIALSIAIVSLPMLAFRTLLLMLFTCPCLHHRNRYPACCHGCCLRCLRGTGHTMGTVYFLGGTALLVLGALTAMRFGSGFVLTWLFSWALSYVLCVLYDLCFPFNCLKTCVWLRRHPWRYVCLGAMRFSGLAQWAIERDTVMKALSARAAGQEQQPLPPADRSRTVSWGGESLRSSWGWGGSDRGWSYSYRRYKEVQVLPV
jgi:hypothetical protein